MFKIKIVNIYKDKADFYCGRGSPLGNPYKIDENNTRDQVCDKYEEYFHSKIKNKDAKIISEIAKIMRESNKKDISLGCFCSPQRCHCETIKRYIEDVQNKQPKT